MKPDKAGERSGRRESAIEPKTLALECARIADEKKARDIVLLAIGEIFPVTDYFLIATGTSRRQLQTVASAVERFAKDHGVRVLGIEGFQQGGWILLDLGSVVVHMFDEEKRAYYDLELLWGDAPHVDI